MKFLKWLVVIAVVLFGLFFFARTQTKKHSPEKTATYEKNDVNLEVSYCSPFKKDRVIFGELVPYEVVWRTGANEPTTFTTATDIKIIDKELPAGTYSLWTKPSKESWAVIFNEEIPGWGVTISSGGAETTRDPDKDAVQVEVPTEDLSSVQESFTIDFEESDELYLTFSWDQTKVKVPINR